MSRSYKKTPWSGDSKGKEAKRLANHKVRNWLKQNPYATLQYSKYKRVYETWDICDFGWITPWEEYWQGRLNTWQQWRKFSPKEEYPERQKEYRKWWKYYKMK